MLTSDIIGLLTVYSYVAILLFVSEKIIKKYPLISRKFLHIMVGNIFFILPLFETQWIMTLLAAAPFILLTFLMTPYSPLKISSGTTTAGHGLGLVYYSIAWTILAYLFFDNPEIISVGIIAMSYGDGIASLIGEKYGKKIYNICGDNKSFKGSFSMFAITILFIIIALIYYGKMLNFLIIISVAAIATIIEGITPRGLDNITVSLSAAITYYLFINWV